MNERKLIVTLALVLALFISTLVLVHWAKSPEVLDESRTAWLKSTLITHRGLHDNEHGIPENSMAAFAKSVAQGYIIELDVSATEDQQLVVIHDKKLSRLFGTDDYLKDMTYAELAQLRFPGSDQRVPQFNEVLAMVDGRVPILIEIKNEDEVGKMESQIYAELKDYPGLYAVESFNPFSVQWFKDNAPEVLRGQISGSLVVTDYQVEHEGATRLAWYKRVLLANLLLDFASRPNFITYEINNVDDSTLRGLRDLGVPVLGYTIENEDDYLRVKDYFDNVVVNTVAIY